MNFISPLANIRDGCSIGDETIIGPFVQLEKNVTIGDACTIQPFSILGQNTIIGHNVFIGPHFSHADCRKVPYGPHGLSPDKGSHIAEHITICSGTIIGVRCTVAPGVVIGMNCIIDMNCNIYKDVPYGTHIKSGTDYR